MIHLSEYRWPSFVTTIVCLLVIISTTEATEIRVPDDYLTIQMAIDAASDGDVILVAPGTYRENLDLLGKNILIRGAEGLEQTFLDGTGIDGWLVTCTSGESESTTIEGLTLQGSEVPIRQGRPEPDGRVLGVRIEESALTVRSCRFRSFAREYVISLTDGIGSSSFEQCIIERNVAPSSYGPIFVRQSSASFSDCIIRDNFGDELITCMRFEYADVELNRCLFEDNITQSHGVVYSREGPLTVRDCTFLQNRCVGHADSSALIVTDAVRCIISGSLFERNESSDEGGAVCLADVPHPTISQCTFRGNSTLNEGSAISAYDRKTKIEIADCIFDANGGKYCHVVYAEYAEIDMQACRFIGNTQTAVYAYQADRLTFDNCEFSNNYSPEDGTIVAVETDLFVSDCQFSAHSGPQGSAIDCIGTIDNHIIIEDSEFRDNEGAVYAHGGEAFIRRCQFERNSTPTIYANGGAVNCTAIECVFEDCVFIDNLSADRAGAVRISNGGDGGTRIERCIFRNNSAVYGGAIAHREGTLDIRSCLFQGNNAELLGGAIRSDDWPLTLRNSLFVENTADYGGAIYKEGVAGDRFIVENCTFADNLARENYASLYFHPDFRVRIANTVIDDRNRFGVVSIPARPSEGLVIRSSNIRQDLSWREDYEAIDADPLFRDRVRGDYRLASGSPCIDSGRNEFVDQSIETDLGRHPRIRNDLGKPERFPQLHETHVVDIGCYEFEDTSESSLSIDPLPIRFSRVFRVRVTNALPDGATWLIYSVVGRGRQHVPRLDITIDVVQPRVLASGRTDARGDWEWATPIPHGSISVPVWFQVVQRGNVTNVIGTSIVP